MALRNRLLDAARALMGVSEYQAERSPMSGGPELDDEVVAAIRRVLGGQLQPIPTTRLRWYLADLEDAQHQADSGNLSFAARLHNAMRGDGYLTGLANTRTEGLVRLPKSFHGNERLAEDLRKTDGSRSVFEELVPPSELAAIAWDGLDLGVSIGELVPVDGRAYPVTVRLDPEFLQYRWTENRWYFQSVAGLLPVTPGDGRWVMHVPGGRIAPWRAGLWRALGKSFINKDHAMQHRGNYSAKLANPARVATAPMGASQPERAGMIRMIMAWAVNSVFEMPPGWDVKLLESKGEGWKVFQEEIDTCNKELMVTIAGQEVTTTGGAGFSNSDVQKVIRQDLIAADAEKLAYTINTQIMPLYAYLNGVDVEERAWMQWSVGTPKDLEGEGRTLQTAAQGIQLLVETFAQLGKTVDVDKLALRFGVPLLEGTPSITNVATPSQPSKEPTPEGQARARALLEAA